MTHAVTAGRPNPLGATFDGEGVNFAVFSANAAAMTLCLFDEDGVETRLDLPERDGDVWHGHVGGLRPGQAYGFRAHGPWAPREGHLFNPAKLLLDPYAKRISGQPVWHGALYGAAPGGRPDPRDSAPYAPRSLVADPAFTWGEDAAPATPVDETVIYEAHVRATTMRHPEVEDRGTFLGMASDPVLDHLTRLGVTAVELLPVHAFIDDRFLVEKGLRNHWGYQSIGFFAPEPRYLSGPAIAEFQQMVARFHAAGLQVVLDVVYNHTGEGDHRGPHLCFRGLDNASYYRLERDRTRYVNDTGTGNTLNLDHPMVLRMVMDSLRYWAGTMRVDGFRFDLATTLGRTGAGGFDPGASFFDAVRQDPLLATKTLIAEPWDIGPGGYQVGAFPPPFLEWNDRWRDTVRAFWKGEPGTLAPLGDAVAGSAAQFDHSGRPATTSVNFVTAHDGFTLADVVAYAEKHNEANGEGNRDGHNENHSGGLGPEGPTDDPVMRAARDRRRRNLFATLMLSQGTPMMLAGDELGHSQEGNNNAYAQDNETTWLDWAGADPAFLDAVRSLIAFRRAHPILRQKRFLHSRARKDGTGDLVWRTAEGGALAGDDWHDPERRLVAVEVRTASGTPDYAVSETALFLVFNGGAATPVLLPDAPEGSAWVRHVDTAAPEPVEPARVAGTVEVAADCVVAFVLEGVE